MKYVDLYDHDPKSQIALADDQVLSVLDVDAESQVKQFRQGKLQTHLLSSDDKAADKSNGIVSSSDRFRRKQFRNVGLSTVPDIVFLDSNIKSLAFAVMELPGTLTGLGDVIALLEPAMQKPLAVYYLHHYRNIEGNPRTSAIVALETLGPTSNNVELITYDKNDQAIIAIDPYDLYLCHGLSATPWETIPNDRLRWIYKVVNKPAENAESTAAKNCSWVVAIDHDTSVSKLDPTGHAHRRSQFLLPLVSAVRRREPKVPHPDMHSLMDIRATLYDEVNSDRLESLKWLLYQDHDSAMPQDDTVGTAHMGDIAHQQALNSVSDQGELLSRNIHHQGNDRSIQRLISYIETRHKSLIEAGLLTWHLDKFSADGRRLVNLIVEFPGAQQDILFIGAHVDSMAGGKDKSYDPTIDPAPGMHDNASGALGCLCCINAFAHLISSDSNELDTLQKTVRICFFNAEEYGRVGSLKYLRKIAARGESIVGAYAMDMIGYTGKDQDKNRLVELHWGSSFNIPLEDNSQRLADIFTATAPGISTLVTFEHFGGIKVDQAENRSDHSSFHWFGVPALTAGHDFFPHGVGDTNYHSKDDKDFDAAYCADIARTVAACTWKLATQRHVHHQSHGSHSSAMAGTEHAGHHAMILVGDKDIHLCHMINMGMAAHHYHYILKVRFDEEGLQEYQALKAKRVNRELDNCLIVGNLLPFTLADVYLGKITSYEAGIWYSRPPDSFVPGMMWPWAKQKPLIKTRVHIDRIVHWRRFSSADNYPDKLTYILFGSEKEAFLQHNQIKQPDFDHVLQITPPKNLDRSFLACANTVTVAGLEERPAGRLRCEPPLNAGDRRLELNFDFSNRSVTTDVIENVWFSTRIVNIGYDGEVC